MILLTWISRAWPNPRRWGKGPHSFQYKRCHSCGRLDRDYRIVEHFRRFREGCRFCGGQHFRPEPLVCTFGEWLRAKLAYLLRL